MTRTTPPPLVCAVLTPCGRGAVATVGVRGPGAVQAVAERFTAMSGRPLASLAEPGRVLFGRFRIGLAQEELVVGIVGPAEVEVHCHGGVAAVEAVAQALIEEGCRRISPAEWAAECEPNPILAAARLALADACTERTAAILLDQYAGALNRKLAKIQDDLQRGDAQSARQSLDRLLAWKELGLHLTHPWRIVIAGRPNVGKSSLINALVGYERAIVFDQPGTTRDVLLAAAAFEGWPVELADTAGLREAADDIEASGVRRAQAEIAAADRVLYVLDTAAPWRLDAEEKRLLDSTKVLIVHNKCDVSPPPVDGRPPGIAVSARTGRGLATLIAAIVAQIVPQAPLRGEAIGFTPLQFAGLARAHEELRSGRLAAAQQQIALLLE